MSQRALVNHYFGSENCACLHWAQTVTVRSQDLRYKLKVHATTCIGLAIHHNIVNKTALERRKTLGHLRSINRNMIIHFANQSQTCELLKIKKKFFFEHFMKRTCEKWCNQSQIEWTDRENPYRLSYYIYICVCVSSSWHNSLTF